MYQCIIIARARWKEISSHQDFFCIPSRDLHGLFSKLKIGTSFVEGLAIIERKWETEKSVSRIPGLRQQIWWSFAQDLASVVLHLPSAPSSRVSGRVSGTVSTWRPGIRPGNTNSTQSVKNGAGKCIAV